MVCQHEELCVPSGVISCACAQTRLAQSKQKTEVAKLSTELDLTARSLKDAKQRFGVLQVQHRKKELEYEKLQNHLHDLLCEKVLISICPPAYARIGDSGTAQNTRDSGSPYNNS